MLPDFGKKKTNLQWECLFWCIVQPFPASRFYEGVPDGVWETWSVRWNGISLIPVRLLPAFVYMECSADWPLTQDMYWSLWVPKYWVPTFIKPLSKKKTGYFPDVKLVLISWWVCSSWAIARSSVKLNLIKFYHFIFPILEYTSCFIKRNKGKRLAEVGCVHFVSPTPST